MVYLTNSAEETLNLGRKLAKNYQNGAVIALIGDLGAGKTTFVQGFAQGLGINNKILSPTFILIRYYDLKKSKGKFYHLDLYRLEKQMEIENLGLCELFENNKNIILIEWAEKLKTKPENLITITFNNLGGDKRQITLA